MTKSNFFSVLLILSAIVFLPVTTKAQVTIGSTDSPQSFSVLELFSNETMGLRLPQLTERQRDAMQATAEFQAEREGLAMGLQIFNTCNRCVETWNGEEWISLCDGETPDPCAGLANLPNPVAFCMQDNPTIADLTAEARSAGGRGTIEWFSAATGGNPLPANHPLADGATYWAGNCAGATNRTSVQVLLVDNCAPITAANIRITTFANVMYDFQHQELISFSVGGQATEWQWQVSTTRTGTYTDIPGATSANWTVPVDLVHNPALVGLTGMPANNELFFRVNMRNPGAPEWREMLNANALGIRFIRTTNSGQGTGFLDGYGITNGVRWATMSRARHNNDDANPDTIRVALLNVGATDNDGVGLGDLFQWGRIADGHQHIVWSKPTTGVARNNIITPMTGGGATSAIIARPDVIADLQINSQGQVGNPDFADRFITGSGDWGHIGTSTPARNGLWGDGDRPVSRANSPLSLADWTESNNNPCPPGWRVPSAAEWGDMYIGDGTGVGTFNASDGGESGQHNIWTWRDMQPNTGAVGGRILTNNDGLNNVFLFLPAVGWRNNSNGALANAGTLGHYWSSTFNGVNTASTSRFDSGSVSAAGSSASNRTSGLSVRCIAEE